MTIKITIETDTWDAIPADLRTALAKAATAPVTAPEPAPQPFPHADIVDALMADISTREATQELIIPLLRKWPQTRGEAKHVLSRLASDLRFNSKRELEFARDFLMKGKHEFFPDRHEVFIAIGSMKLHQAKDQMRAMDQGSQTELNTGAAAA